VTNPADAFNDRANDREERDRNKPRDSLPDIASPQVFEHLTAEGTGLQDTDIMREFHAKYAHLFCMDDVGKGSEIYIYRNDMRMWLNREVKEQIRSYVSTIATEYTRELQQVQAALIGAAADDRDALGRRQTVLTKLIQRCGRGNTIGTIASLLHDHLVTIHIAKPVTMNPDPTVLNCANGVVDLNTGKLRWQRPEDYLTVSTGTEYDPDIDYSWWENAVRNICDQQQDLYDFLCSWVGYSATGLRRDHALVVLFGTGRNGKSLLIDAISEALGDYAFKLPRGFLETKKFGSDNNEQYAMAGLNGARFAYASEAAEGSELKAEMVKAITGDKTITARSSHQDFKTFQITHKITLATNYKPKVSADDDAIFARLKLFPCTVRFGPPDEVDIGEAKYVWDQKMLERCSTVKGRSAVLRWIAMCAQKYLKEGELKTPLSIKHQIALHRKNMDAFGTFLIEATEYLEKIETDKLESLCGSGGTAEKRETWKAMTGFQRREVERTTFYRMYRVWCKSMGIDRPRSQIALNEYLANTMRVWTDDYNEEQLKMTPMKIMKVGTVWKWRWVKLSARGLQLYEEARGDSEYDRNSRM
jgi:P4 family phage/plasmid primase-like protien